MRSEATNGGAEGTQTPGLYNANVALYQLSYSPTDCPGIVRILARKSRRAGRIDNPLPLRIIQRPLALAGQAACVDWFLTFGGHRVTSFLEIRRVSGVTVVTLKDAKIMDERTIAGVSKALHRLVRPRAKVVVDFANVELISAPLLISFLKVLNAFWNEDGALALCGIDRKLLKVFDLCKVKVGGKPIPYSEYFRIRRTEMDALETL